jgi:Na+-driven multidrug efflux pump
VVGTVLGFAFFVFGFLTDGITAHVAAAFGTGDKKLLGKWMKTALVAGLLSGVIATIAFGPSYQQWLSLFQSDPSSNEYHLTVVWYWTRLFGLIPNLAYNAIVGVLQGLQMPVYIVLNNIFLAVIDILCNYLFLNVWDLGAAGSPLGINVAFLASFIFALVYLKTKSHLYEMRPWRDMLPRHDNILFIQDSFNLMARSFLVEMSAFLIPLALKTLSTADLVANTSIVAELSKYSYFIPVGVGAAANILGSYFRGRREFQSFRTLLLIVPAVGLCMGIFFCLVC